MSGFAISLSFVGQIEFWLGVGVLAGIYGIFTTGLQLNVGFTGILNFGQVGFMAIGAYTMAILVTEAGWSFWLAMPAATVVAMIAGVIVGLPSLRLRADYFAIATLALAEVIRYTAQNARGLTGGNQGMIGFDSTWIELSNRIQDSLGTDQVLMPLLIVTWVLFLGLVVIMARIQRTPWGRVLRAIREDEDAARAVGKSTVSYKLQSLAIAAALASIAGFLLAMNLAFINPDQFDAQFTFLGYAVLVLGGLASYRGVVVGTIVFWTLFEATRLMDLPLAAENVAALRLMLVGAVLIALAVWRPQGLLGRKEEMVLGR